MLSPQQSLERAPLDRILQQERLVTIGRVISSFVHEINNPLQAIRGALSLAQDEIENPSEIKEYIAISQQEIEHISVILNQVRLIYRAQNDQPELFPMTVPFRDAIELTREEAMRQRVKVQNLLPAQSPLVEVVYNHFYIVILRTMLAFIDAIGAAGGGDLTIKVEESFDQLELDYVARAPIPVSTAVSGVSLSSSLLSQFDLSSSCELLKANGGQMEFQSDDGSITLRILLPNVM